MSHRIEAKYTCHGALVEGAGGPLTGLDPEESPLSLVRAAWDDPGVREGRHCSRNERQWACTMKSQDGDFPTVDETSTPAGASPNRPVDVARVGPGRTHS